MCRKIPSLLSSIRDSNAQDLFYYFSIFVGFGSTNSTKIKFIDSILYLFPLKRLKD